MICCKFFIDVFSFDPRSIVFLFFDLKNADLFWEMTQDGRVPALTSKFTGKSYASKAVNDQLADIVTDMIYQQALRQNTVRFKWNTLF